MGSHARSQPRESITDHDVQRALAFLERALATLHEIRPQWMASAECRGADTAIFFPRRGESTDALDYCRRCAVCGHRRMQPVRAVIRRENARHLGR